MDGQRGFLTKQANVWAKHSPEGVGEERFPSRDYLSKNVNAPVKNHWANVFMIAIQHQFKKQKRSSYWPPPTVVLVNIIFPGLLWVTRFNQPPPPPPGTGQPVFLAKSNGFCAPGFSQLANPTLTTMVQLITEEKAQRPGTCYVSYWARDKTACQQPWELVSAAKLN